MKIPHRSRVFKTRVLCKKNFTYSGVFKPYSDILKLYSGVFLPKKNCKYQVWEPYSSVFKPYSGVLKPYSSVFMQFMEIKSLKLDFHVDFLQRQTYPLTNRDLKTWVLDTRDASFKHCFETWQLTKFFYIYWYLARTIVRTATRMHKLGWWYPGPAFLGLKH